jgi:glutamate-ammonia-ligase adenylyltransferase
VVFGLGKLGGGELNFSSDIDLVYAYEHDGRVRRRAFARAEDWFRAAGPATGEAAGRSRPPTASAIASTCACVRSAMPDAWRCRSPRMEQYFQREGRDWERYAWQKARPVAGDIAAGERLLQALRPFVYRRYLDYGALDGLREMKAAIAAEVARKDWPTTSSAARAASARSSSWCRPCS